MPPRLDVLKKCWSTVELPILPFLAPRVFKPWPFDLHRNYHQSVKKRAKIVENVREPRPGLRNSDYGQLAKERDREIAQEEGLFEPDASKTTSKEEEFPAPDGIQHDKQELRKKALLALRGYENIKDAEFLSKYAETWLSRSKKQPPKPHQAQKPPQVQSPPQALSNLRYGKDRGGVRVGRQLSYRRIRGTTRLPINLQEALSLPSPSTTFHQIWGDLDVGSRSIMLPELMRNALEHSPDAAMNYLEATYIHPYPPTLAVSQTLNYIIEHKILRSASDDPDELDRFVKRVRVLLYLVAQNRVYLRQNAIHLMISRMNNAINIMRFYVTLKQIKHPMHENTLLQFASRLSKLESKGAVASLEVLQRMKDLDCPLNTPKMLSVFSTMLSRPNRDSNARLLDSTILKFMMESGISPNIITYNILLENSMRDGEFETGWNIYEMMAVNGIEPDDFTYSSLLNDSKVRMDANAIKQVISIIREKGIWSPYIATDILHAIFLLQRGNTHGFLQDDDSFEIRSKPAFDSMLQVYHENFHTEPLEDFIPAFRSRDSHSFETAIHSQNTRELQSPPSVTLVVMITAYLAKLQNPESLREFYEHFLVLLEAGNPFAVGVAKQIHFWSVIIMNFSRFTDGLAYCPEIVGYMLSKVKNRPSMANSEVAEHEDDTAHLDPLQPTFSAQRASYSSEVEAPNYQPIGSEPIITKTSQSSDTPGSQVNCATPDVYTWSILLKIFMDHQQPRAAERVLEMMGEHGVNPNRATWNTLIVGYSKMQATVEAVDALRRMEDAGFRPDDITLKALSKLTDKRTLYTAMETNENLKAQSAKMQKEGIAQDVEDEENETFDSDELIRKWDLADEDQERESATSQAC